MYEIPGLIIVLASFIDGLLASLSERELAGNNISNSGPNVMYSDVNVNSVARNLNLPLR